MIEVSRTIYDLNLYLNIISYQYEAMALSILSGLPEIPASIISRMPAPNCSEFAMVCFPMGKAARVDERIPPAHPLGVTNLGGGEVLKGF